MESRNSSRPNRLIKEKSPYLLQHAHNPVDWYPWGKEAFDKAREENKPVFLSIGYSTCHWCHVMEKESFEDPDVAKLLNKFFICIKVDREERPDVDGIYMTVCQMLTQRGGWPLTILMTPDKKPFFAATYLPKTSRFRQTGLLELIPRIHRLWIEQKEELVHSAERIFAAVKASSVRSLEVDLGENILHTAFQHISRTFDQRHGGFSAAPKFPTPHILAFLLRYWSLTKKEQALFMVEKSLTSMRRGGIFDHVGYGFHRYSTDIHWLLPHFEKMIYDQALLAMAYTETFQTTKNSQYREVAEEIFTYVLSQMTSPDGGFFSAEDADSEGEEGKFYTWSVSEIMNALTQQEADLAILAYNLEKEGNFQDETTGSKSGRNVLYFKKNLEEISSTLKLESNVLPDRMERIRQKLWAARKERIHPLRDEKILSDWNGLMIAALAKGGRVFENSKYTNAAQKASEFILERMTDKKGGLLHRYKDGEASIEAYADDYAFLIWGLLELFETTFLTQYLQHALQLNQLFIRHFWDKQEGAFFFTSDKAKSLPLRRKEIYDGAIPSSNSVAMLNLLKLGRMTANPDLENKAHQIGKYFSGEITRFPSAYTQMLTSLHFSQGQAHEIVIVGNSQQRDTREMIKAIRSEFIPNKVVLFVPSEEKNPDILKLMPFLADYKALDGKATAYVCSSYTCKNPTTKSELMLRQLTQP